MLLTLVKNELIKMMKKGKTWIIFALFFIMIIGMNVVSYYSDKQMEYYASPEGQIEMINREIGWQKESLKDTEEYNKKHPSEDNEANIENAKQNLINLEERLKLQEERKVKGDDPLLWKKDLQLRKKEYQEQLNDERLDKRDISYYKTEIERIDAIEKAGIKPVELWEFGAFNNMVGLFNTLGLIILVAGIAVFMSDIVSGESTPPTLKFLLVQPISRGKMLASKFIAVIITVVTMIGGIELLNFLLLGVTTGFENGKMPIMVGQKTKIEISEQTGGYPQLVNIPGTAKVSDMFTYTMQSFALQILFIIACCSFIFLISTVIKNSMITMAIAVIISVATTMISMSVPMVQKISHMIFLNYGATPHVFTGEVAYMFNNPGFTPVLGVILMVITTVICPIIAYFIFKKKDILI